VTLAGLAGAAARIVALLVGLAAWYEVLRLRLWARRLWWRLVFRAKLRGLPPGLRRELYRSYVERLHVARLPGLRELLRVAL